MTRELTLAERVQRLIRPEALAKDEPLVWSAGRGTDVWAIFCASMTGDLDTVTRLVTADPSLVRAHWEYHTALHFAVRENQLDVATFLLERGADPYGLNGDLMETAHDRGYTEIAQLLIRRCASTGGPLIQSAAKGRLQIVKLLLEGGADPNLREEGNAPNGRALYAAVYRGHLEVARLLLEHGAYPNPEVESSADALSIAIMNSDTAMIDLLVAHGAKWQIPVQLAAE
jgi:ankyrin repeat protein